MVDSLSRDGVSETVQITYVERKKAEKATAKIDKITSNLSTEKILETRRLIKEAANSVSNVIGYKKKENKKENNHSEEENN